jgi:hypothetical protein
MVEIVVLVANGWRYPLTDVAARYTDDRQDNFDVYLPLWLVLRDKQVFGPWSWVGGWLPSGPGCAEHALSARRRDDVRMMRQQVTIACIAVSALAGCGPERLTVVHPVEGRRLEVRGLAILRDGEPYARVETSSCWPRDPDGGDELAACLGGLAVVYADGRRVFDEGERQQEVVQEGRYLPREGEAKFGGVRAIRISPDGRRALFRHGGPVGGTRCEYLVEEGILRRAE